ncbi:MAG: HD domain-containing protein [Oscillospiraceae bacterium]|nr:HD domain-containing protein [Oscillospiraceae bacterium]
MNIQQNLQIPRRKRNLITLFMCIAGVAVNLILNHLAGMCSLPLYLDTVGSIVIAVLGGYLPAVIVGFTTNILKGISDPASMYYGVLNVMIAVCAAWFSSRGWFRKPAGIAGMILVFTLIGGGLGTLIPWFMDDLAFDSESLSGILYDTGFFGQESAHLLASLLMDLLDKAVSVLISVLMIHLIPKRFYPFFNFNGWMQTPLSAEESAAAKKLSFRVMSLRTKILLVLTVSLVTVSAAATVISVVLYRNALMKEHTQLAVGTSRIAASVLEGDQIDMYLRDGETAPGYAETNQMLREILTSSANIQYLYVYQIREDGCHVVFDLDTETISGDPVGTVIPFDDGFKPYLNALLAGEEIEPVITNDSYGYLLTAYSPVYDSDGRCVCYAAADVEMNQIRSIEREFLVEMLALFLGFFILIYVFVNWLIEYHIILPVNSIAMSTGAFAYDNEKTRQNSIEHIHDLQIHTGDEVENLYLAISKTSDDSMKYVADVQKKTEELAQMQNALIMVLADIVESRDKNTGAHVRKTAAYTEIILHEMCRRGYYAETLTDEYISDVVSSAPLHDVGKIQVPDAILNKPGKLTDEEFAVMKQHAAAGRDIISQAISLVPNSGYLDEARNLAAYHHEKWNGKGYPYGLAGEEIPLSARVMAVADVFDALVSKRSYKQPFSYEKAMEIIKEGSGSHFDPLIVDAFVSAGEEVRLVEQKFSQMTDDSGCFPKK